jgi:hypothetical protein
MKVDLLNELDRHTNTKIDSKLKGIGEQLQISKKNEMVTQSQLDKLLNDNTHMRNTLNQFKLEFDSELSK